eukprot:325897-Pyramimonas_sp.AAC.1
MEQFAPMYLEHFAPWSLSPCLWMEHVAPSLDGAVRPYVSGAFRPLEPFAPSLDGAGHPVSGWRISPL